MSKIKKVMLSVPEIEFHFKLISLNGDNNRTIILTNNEIPFGFNCYFKKHFNFQANTPENRKLIESLMCACKNKMPSNDFGWELQSASAYGDRFPSFYERTSMHTGDGHIFLYQDNMEVSKNVSVKQEKNKSIYTINFREASASLYGSFDTSLYTYLEVPNFYITAPETCDVKVTFYSHGLTCAGIYRNIGGAYYDALMSIKDNPDFYENEGLSTRVLSGIMKNCSHTDVPEYRPLIMESFAKIGFFNYQTGQVFYQHVGTTDEYDNYQYYKEGLSYQFVDNRHLFTYSFGFFRDNPISFTEIDQMPGGVQGSGNLKIFLSDN